MNRKMNRLLMLLVVSLWSSLAFSQGKKLVTGIVKDSSGSPLAGVTVRVKGTKTVAASDGAGIFKVEAAPADDLIISFIGFEQQEVSVGDRSEISIILNSSMASLDNVVVTSLGIAKQQKSLGYATTTVKSDELIKTAP